MKSIYHSKSFTTQYHYKFLVAIVVLFITLSTTLTTAQVRTTILGKGQKISTLMPGYIPDEPDVKILPNVDLRKVLEEDRKRDSQLPRFGVRFQ